MSEAIAKEEHGAKGIGDCNIANLKKDDAIKTEQLLEDAKIKKEIKIKEEPVKVEIKNEPLEEDVNKWVKKELEEEEGKETIHNIEMKEEIKVKEEPVDVKLKNESLEDNDNSRMKKECDEEERKEAIMDVVMDEEESDDSDENEMERDEYQNDSEDDEKEIKEYPYVIAIRHSIDMIANFGTFACGEILEKAKLKLSVKGVGEIKLPLSYRQGEVLKSKACTEAPYGKGSETLVDKNVREAWQVDAKDVSLDKNFDKLIKENIPEIMKTLGESSIENQQVVSELYKLVYYEKGGHFVPHRDTEKAPGMFATLVIQLPAGHEGGELVVKHKGETKVFDFEVDSRENYYYTAFFADCEHELKRIIGGHRLVLIYNLIRKDPLSTLNHSLKDDTKPSNIQNFISKMTKSVQEWETDNKGPLYWALKLDHLYTDTNISFQHLKGKDKKKVDALCLCENIKVYLATITKYETRVGYNDSGSDPGLAPREEFDDDEMKEPTTYQLDNWIGVNNEIVTFGERKLDKDETNIKEYMSMEDDERCDSDYEFTGNEGCDIKFTYEKRALVILPKSFELSMSCASNLGSALVNCKSLSESNIDDALEMFKGILLYIEKSHTTAMNQLKGEKVAIIFEMMILFENTIKVQAKTLLLALAKTTGSGYCSKKVGLPDKRSAIALAKLIQKLGWKSLRNKVILLVEKCATSQIKSFVQLVNSLLSLGLREEAIKIVVVAASQFLGIKGLGLNFQTLISNWQANGWKNLSLESVTLIWPIVLIADKDNHDGSLLKHFVQAVIDHKNSNIFLKELLKLPEVVEAKEYPSVQLIVKKRLQQLDVAYPVFSWAMPNASGVTNSTTVGLSLFNFLKSDQESMTFEGVFEGKPHADRFGAKYFGYWQDKSKYSARCVVSGRGKNVQCKVTKTKEYFNEQVKEYNLMLKEAKFLKEIFCESKIIVSHKRSRE